MAPPGSTRRSCQFWFALIVPLALAAHAAPNAVEQNWTQFVRIGAYGLKADNAAQIVENAQQDARIWYRSGQRYPRPI